MHKLLNPTTIVCLALAFPIAGLADLNGTPTLVANTALNLDTGAIGSSGSIQWSGSSMTPQGGAKAVDMAALGALFDAYTQTLVQYTPGYSTSAIPGTDLAPDDMFFVETAVGHFAKVLVTGRSDTSISLKFTTFGVSPIVTGPNITAVVDAAAYTPSVAQGSVFVVKGQLLCGTGTVYGSVPYSAAPLNGVQIAFTPVGGGAAVGAYMVYTYGAGSVTQLAAILPSSVAAGDYNVTVTNGGSLSAAFKTTVVAHKFGIITVNGSGAGRAVVQNYISASQYDLGRYTSGTVGGYTISPAHPGQIIVIWGTGMGAITSPDNALPGAIDLRGSLDIQVLLDGVAIKPDLYAGRAPTLPGADEIVMTLPANVSTGCFRSLAIQVNGQISNSATIAIAAVGDSACTLAGFTTAQLAKLDLGGKITVGTPDISGGILTEWFDGVPNTTRADGAGALFYALDADQLGAYIPPSSITPANNTCVVTRRIVTSGSGSTTAGGIVLDAGNLLLNGPNVSNVPVSVVTLLGSNTPGVTAVKGAVLAPGTYTITGAGGKDVGPFQSSIKMSDPLVLTGGIASTISRSQDFTLTWTGGGTDAVTITGEAGAVLPGTDNKEFDLGEFTCLTTADKGTFSIPASILQQLPAATSGELMVSSNAAMSTFTASLVAGGTLDFGYFSTGFINEFFPAFK